MPVAAVSRQTHICRSLQEARNQRTADCFTELPSDHPAIFTEYPGVGHNSWVPAYADLKFYE